MEQFRKTQSKEQKRNACLYKHHEGLTTHVVTTEEELLRVAEYIRQFDIVSIDFEGNGKPIQDPNFKAVGFSLAVDQFEGWYFPFGHKAPRQKGFFSVPLEQLDQTLVLNVFRFVWEEKKLVNHNIKYDSQCLMRLGESIMYWEDSPKGGGIYFDTFIAQKIMHPLARENGQKPLTREYLDRDPLEYEEVTGKDKDFSVVGLDFAEAYACPDPINCLGLYYLFMRELSKKNEFYEGCRNVLFNYEFPLIIEVAIAEMQGIKLNPAVLKQVDDMTKLEMAPLEAKMRTIVYQREPEFDKQFGRPFELGSNQLLLQTLNEVFGVYVTDDEITEDSLEPILKGIGNTTSPRKIQIKNFIEALLEWKEPYKIGSTYSLNLLEKSTNGVLYPELDQVGTASGRFSSRKPNGQNFPKVRSKYPVRKSMLPAIPGWKWVIADYKAMEMFITAALSNCSVLKAILLGHITIFDKGLAVEIKDPKAHYEKKVAKLLADHMPEAKALEEAKKIDIHLYTGAFAFSKPYDLLTGTERDQSKIVNFGIIYGVTKYGLSRQMKTTEDRAEAVIQGYLAAYPGVAKWIRDTEDELFAKGYVMTEQGRSRMVPEYLRGRPREAYRAAMRWAPNHKVQGFSGYQAKLAMKKLAKAMREHKLQAKLTLQIHDELFVVSPVEETQKVGELMLDSMRLTYNGVTIESDGYKISDTLAKE